MKRMTLILVLLFTAASLFAGGKDCDIKKGAAKNVELTGTLVSADDGHKTIFRVAGRDLSYTVCDKTSADILKLANEGTLRVKGKVVSCDEAKGEELMISEAKKI